MRVSFTGHRPKELFGQHGIDNPEAKLLASNLTKLIEKLIVDKNADTFVSGGALGLDQIAFICVHHLKKKYPHIKNILAVPYKDQPTIWEAQLEKAINNGWDKVIKEAQSTVQRYENILKVADKIVYVDEIDKYKPRNMKDEDIGKHSNQKLQLRNIYMLDESDLLIAVYNGSGKGGTYNCIKSAKGKKMPIIYVDPNNDFKIGKGD